MSILLSTTMLKTSWQNTSDLKRWRNVSGTRWTWTAVLPSAQDFKISVKILQWKNKHSPWKADIFGENAILSKLYFSLNTVLTEIFQLSLFSVTLRSWKCYQFFGLSLQLQRFIGTWQRQKTKQKSTNILRLVSLSLHMTHMPGNYFYFSLTEYMVVTQHSNAVSTKLLLLPSTISSPK